MRISDWSSDVCSSDLRAGKRQPLLIAERQGAAVDREIALEMKHRRDALDRFALRLPIETIDASKEIQILADAEIAVERKFLRHIAKRTARLRPRGAQIETRHPAVAARRRQKTAEHLRSEEHTSELQSLMRTSYAVFCLKKKKITKK